jgi:hypothetical protein
MGIERAGGAAGRGIPQARDRRPRRDEISGGCRLDCQAVLSLVVARSERLEFLPVPAFVGAKRTRRI